MSSARDSVRSLWEPVTSVLPDLLVVALGCVGLYLAGRAAAWAARAVARAMMWG